MPPSEPASITDAHRGSSRANSDQSDAECTVVWLHGEHDLATKGSISSTIARAAHPGGGDLLVDLSEVTFMDASTLGALVGSRNWLRSRSRSLHVRAPSRRARRIFEVCGLGDLISPAAASTVHPAGAAAALGTWVEVPSSGSCGEVVDPPVSPERLEPARPLLDEAARPPRDAPIEAQRGSP